MSSLPQRPLISRACASLSGQAVVPGDKSISHRSLMFGAMALGKTEVSGLLEGEDVLRTAQAMRQLGAEVTRRDDGVWEIHGRGVGVWSSRTISWTWAMPAPAPVW